MTEISPNAFVKRAILNRLARGPATTEELIDAIYGSAAAKNLPKNLRNTVICHICQLKQAGISISRESRYSLPPR